MVNSSTSSSSERFSPKRKGEFYHLLLISEMIEAGNETLDTVILQALAGQYVLHTTIYLAMMRCRFNDMFCGILGRVNFVNYITNSQYL